MKKLFYLCLLVTVFGCEKETNDIINYPSILVANEYQVLSDVKLFTRKGQITDNTVINSYLAKDTSGIFYQNKTSYFSKPKTDTLLYQTRDTVIFSLPGEWGKRLPKQVGDYIYFCMPDTLIGFKTLQQEGPFNEIIRQIGLFKPYYEEVAIGSNYQRVFDAFVAKGNAEKLEFPYIT